MSRNERMIQAVKGGGIPTLLDSCDLTYDELVDLGNAIYEAATITLSEEDKDAFNEVVASNLEEKIANHPAFISLPSDFNDNFKHNVLYELNDGSIVFSLPLSGPDSNSAFVYVLDDINDDHGGYKYVYGKNPISLFASLRNLHAVGFNDNLEYLDHLKIRAFGFSLEDVNDSDVLMESVEDEDEHEE